MAQSPASRSRPTTNYESHLIAQGYSAIAGVDEVGRGPLAGPVVAAAVILPRRLRGAWVANVRDSKEMTPEGREETFRRLVDAAITYGVGACDNMEIDRLGIVGATRIAMARAIDILDPAADHLLIDALALPALPVRQTPIIDGDALCRSIAAASVIAKVTRDRLMATVFEQEFPGYGFSAHKGYATPEHIRALNKLGPTRIHRRSFAPVRELMGRRVDGRTESW